MVRENNIVIIDMGGTTSDISLVKKCKPLLAENGVSIGKWKTFVKGLYVKTFGLGGDSAVRYKNKKVYLESFRVVPLCVAARDYPIIIENLKELGTRNHSHFLYEHYMLVKDISGSKRYTPFEKDFCRLLQDNPLTVSQAAEAAGKDVYTLNIQRLIHDGAVQRIGLTPTDIMHIKGDFDIYDTQASLLGAAFAAFNLDISVEDFCGAVYDEVKRKLYIHIAKALYENKYPDFPHIERVIDESYASANEHDLISPLFKTDYTLVGIGAPIRVFIKDVAKKLGTYAVIPKHYEVANALGAVMGSISASFSVEIRPVNDASGTVSYTVFGMGGAEIFENMEDAEMYAVAQAKAGAEAEAVKRGAKGELDVSVDRFIDEAQAKDCMVYLGTTITAYAVGK
jgi:N-methylhydantoinase A/oxoprolinase/acetone carboxylase beta subunit